MEASKTPIDETKVLADVSDTLTDKPITFKVHILNLKVIDRILIWLKCKKPFKEFAIRPSSLGTMVKISKELLTMDAMDLESKNIIHEMIGQQSYRMARVISVAIVNRKEDPPEGMITFLIDNLSSVELHKLVGVVVRNLDVTSFMKSIISLKGANLLRSAMNPVEQRSHIASGEQLAG